MGHRRYAHVTSAQAETMFQHGQGSATAPRILIVDDHALVRHGLALVLKLRFPDAVVFEAGSLAEASQWVKEEAPLSLVLYDLQMGDTDGLPGVEAMLRILDGVPLVVISGTHDADVIFACIRAGARGFLPKGGNVEALEHALPIVLGGGIYAPLPPTGSGNAPQPAPQAPPRPPTSPAMEGLTLRQREILMLLLEGRSNKEIARALGILEGTIKVHLRSIMQRLGVRNRTQLALMAAKAGLPS